LTDLKERLLERLTERQSLAVTSDKRRVLVVAGAGSGKTEVMARRVAWWISMQGVPKKDIVAFTFTDRAAEEIKFRIRYWLEKITPPGEEVSLGGMYIGTIHGFCLAKLREYWPDVYHNYDILDEGARTALILRGFHGLLGLSALQNAAGLGQFATISVFAKAYDQLHEHNVFDVKLPSADPPVELGAAESEWCKKAELLTNVGDTPEAAAFAVSVARYYAYLRCRRFLDFSTSQSEFVRSLHADPDRHEQTLSGKIHLVVDEVQDINPVQLEVIKLLTGRTGSLTAVGDHRQSIYGFRGAKVEIIGKIWEGFKKAQDAEVVDLEENFRSTPMIIDLANRWSNSIGRIRTMETTPMKHGNKNRLDHHRSHMALVSFTERAQEAAWIADAIGILVPPKLEGALHDKKDGTTRGLTLSDIAVLVRSATDMRTYMQALEAAGIPCIVRAGPDLFSQPEILLFISVLAITAGHDQFFGSPNYAKSLPGRIQSVLGCAAAPEIVFHAAAMALRQAGLAFSSGVEERVLDAAKALRNRIAENKALTKTKAAVFRTPKLREFLTSHNELRRVFPQQIFHMLLSEAEVDAWDTGGGRGQSALFHLGALSGLITGIETPGWTSVGDYKWQMIGLCQYGAEEGRTEEQPLMVQPDAVSIITIHGAKGLEFAAVFLADVNTRRFPSQFAPRIPSLPLDGKILTDIDVKGLADNANNDGERRLMYVALTRAERFLFVSHSGKQTSVFIKELKDHFRNAKGFVTDKPAELLAELKYAPKEHQRDIRIATSFSDLRYYLECPHDFYIRKVLGFSPTIDQAFGYGRGVHNLLRAVHSHPKKWAAIADDPAALEREILKLIDRGLFYLRYTTGEPASNMRAKGVQVTSQYIKWNSDELAGLEFEPEKEFETLIEYEDGNGGALVSGAIDIVRQDDPPRVTLIDFKSGDPDSERHQILDQELMRLQVALYAVAVKKELEYRPEQGLVRYLGVESREKSELPVPLDKASLNQAKKKVADTAKAIRDRRFFSGPSMAQTASLEKIRCAECDFGEFCGMGCAKKHRKSRDSR
jgi:DNA helicase-2/ATP-dependent DNA helicase PcrA